MLERLTERLADVGMSVEPVAAEALAVYLGEIRRWNRVHNLTAITDPEAMIRRHVIESLALRPLLAGRRIADVGSGAGIPGIPLAIAAPDRHFTLIESRGKRAAFLRHVQGVLGLVNVAVEHGRVEEMDGAGDYDTLLAKALAPPGELLRLTAHLFGPDTVMLAPTGKRWAAGGEIGVDGAIDERSADEAFDVRRVDKASEEPRVNGRFEIRRAEGEIQKLIGGSLLIISMKRG